MSQAQHSVKMLSKEFVTHDVQSFIVERPESFEFQPGQATELSLAAEGWRDEKRPFTFTSHVDAPLLQFKIKRYPEHKGVTRELHRQNPGAEFLIGPAWGTIAYKGKGVFLAGGAGITPFIAILRDLQRRKEIAGNTLIFSNKTAADVILEKEFRWMFRENPGNLLLTLTREQHEGYLHGRIDKAFLEREIEDFHQPFYICGPPEFVDSLKEGLDQLGANTDSMVFEE